MALSGSERTCQRDHSTTVENLGALRQKKSAMKAEASVNTTSLDAGSTAHGIQVGMVINSGQLFAGWSIYLQRN